MLQSSQLFAQVADTLSVEISIFDKLFGFADNMVDPVSTDTWTFIPAINYASETGIGIGGSAMKIF